MSVKRYEVNGSSSVFENENGSLVDYEDYAALEARCAALAAENAGLKSKGRELLGEACAVYAKLNKLIDPTIGDFVDGQTLHEFQFVLDVETPATDAFLAEVRAQESAPLVRALTVIANSEQHDGETVVCDFDTLISVAAGSLSDHYADQLRKGLQS
ncbi:hypothetical protein [Citrobacter koseri]|uniref:hypothetical protein n=1 Tax=Citrobacter koseri TaxID=545 RepID=UPI003D04DB3C